LARYGLDHQNCQGQGYDDGATNMSGVHGIPGPLSAENPIVDFVHCNYHILNLCIVGACRSPPIRRMSSAFAEAASFFQIVLRGKFFMRMCLIRELPQLKLGSLYD